MYHCGECSLYKVKKTSGSLGLSEEAEITKKEDLVPPEPTLNVDSARPLAPSR